MFIEITGTVFEVEHWTRLVVGELLKQDCAFIVFVEDASGKIPGKPRIEPSSRVSDSLADALGFAWIGLVEGDESFAEAGCVLVGNREDANAALGTSWAANKMLGSAAIGVGYCRVHDLDERRAGCHNVRPLEEAVLSWCR
jgi:hypothetical protein